MRAVDPRFKALKFGCHLGMRRNWYGPFKDIQEQSLRSDPNQKVGRKLEMLLWKIITRYLKKLEEFRIQSSLHVYNKPQR